jgi:hypothetical protein
MNAHSLTVAMLAALLAVLTLASSAWAGCAWVLWVSGIERNTHVTDYPWTPTPPSKV